MSEVVCVNIGWTWIWVHTTKLTAPKNFSFGIKTKYTETNLSVKVLFQNLNVDG